MPNPIGFDLMNAPANDYAAGAVITPAGFDARWHVNLRVPAAVWARLGEITAGAYAMPAGTEIFAAVDAATGAVLHGAPPAIPAQVWLEG